MEFSVFLSCYYPDTKSPAKDMYALMLAEARLAEALGYCGVTVPEHHFMNVLMNPDPLMLAVKVADATTDNGPPDPQTKFHSDTFHSTSKGWMFLRDVEEADGPFAYVPGSHRMTAGRLEWEYKQSLTAAQNPKTIMRWARSVHHRMKSRQWDLANSSHSRCRRTH